MERAPWFLDPEILMFGQVAGIAIFLVALTVTVLRRRLRTVDAKHSKFHLSKRKVDATRAEFRFPGAPTSSAGGSRPGC